jgi:ubiquinone/menaquinone biosynthesis C-methylase UbiE
VNLTDVFNEAHAEPPSPRTTAIWREALGDEYPEGADPYSWVSRSELDVFSDVVRETGPRLVDVGCGRGGPGLWVAKATGADLVGIDIARTGLDAAEASARALGSQAEFRLGSFEELPLDDREADVVMSVDAFLFTPDKRAAALELARVIRPNGRLAMTTWDYHTQPDNRPPQVEDHRPLLEEAGFAVERYDDTDEWERRLRRTTDAMLEQVEELAAESAQDPDELRESVREMAATFDCMIRRVLVVARRSPSPH